MADPEVESTDSLITNAMKWQAQKIYNHFPMLDCFSIILILLGRYSYYSTIQIIYRNGPYAQWDMNYASTGIIICNG